MRAGPRRRVVALGEAMLRLTAPPGEALEQAQVLRGFVAGSEANVARALARLGVESTWVSALPVSPLGERVLRELRADGVDTSAVTRVAGGRLGLFFVEQAQSPRSTTVWYDRAGSAFARMSEFPSAALDGAAVALVSGITPGLGARGRALARSFVAAALERGARVCVDVNHRRTLWSAAAARRGIGALIERAAIVICSERDAQDVFGLAGEPSQVLRALRSGFCRDAETVVLTRAEHGAAMLADGEIIEAPARPTTVVDRFGVGDAFTAGLLWGIIGGRARGEALRAATTLASMKATVAGDAAPFAAAELEAVMRTAGTGVISR